MFSPCTQSNPLVTEEEHEVSPAFPNCWSKGRVLNADSGVVELVIFSDFSETSQSSVPPRIRSRGHLLTLLHGSPA